MGCFFERLILASASRSRMCGRGVKMKQAEREERFNAIVKRIESTPESQAIFAAAKASERGPTCLACGGKDRRIAELEAEIAQKSEASEQAEIKIRYDAYRAAMRLSIINAGGIAEPRVSDSFLIKNVPAEMLALRRLYVAYRAAMRQIMGEMEGGPISAGISDAELLRYAATGFPASLRAIIERRDGEGQ